MIHNLAFVKNRNHKSNTPNLKHKDSTDKNRTKKISCQATRKQHLIFWRGQKPLREILIKSQWFPKMKQAFLEGDEAGDWETVP